MDSGLDNGIVRAIYNQGLRDGVAVALDTAKENIKKRGPLTEADVDALLMVYGTALKKDEKHHARHNER